MKKTNMKMKGADMADPAILRHLDEQYDILQSCLAEMDERFRALMIVSALVDGAQTHDITLRETLAAVATVWRWKEDEETTMTVVVENTKHNVH